MGSHGVCGGVGDVQLHHEPRSMCKLCSYFNFLTEAFSELMPHLDHLHRVGCQELCIGGRYLSL